MRQSNATVGFSVDNRLLGHDQSDHSVDVGRVGLRAAAAIVVASASLLWAGVIGVAFVLV